MSDPTSSDPDYSDLASLSDAALLERLCDRARGVALGFFRGPVLQLQGKNSPGERFDPVTVADREIEERLREMLEIARPDDAVLGEEFGEVEGSSGRLWALDPIDGTRAFVSGLLNWGVLIGLYQDGKPVLGALDQPYLGERFIGALAGSEGPLATLSRGDQQRRLKTRACSRLSDATLFTTDPALFETEAQKAAFERVAAEARLVRYGTDCYGYAMLAAGHADLVIEAGLSAYDVGALIPLVEAAGGRFTSWSGGSAASGGAVLAAGDPALHEAAKGVLNA